MHRLMALFAVFAVFAGIVAFALGDTVTAQDEMASHPVAGTWTWVNGEGDEAFPSINFFHPDGTYIEVLPWGAVLMGVWQPTGERTATVTQIINYLDDDGELVQGQGRGTVEVDETGNTIFWQSSFLSRYQDGRTDIAADIDDPGQMSIGTRLEPQPMASLEELMATPVPFGSAATPTS
jgi:hypothetical protein